MLALKPGYSVHSISVAEPDAIARNKREERQMADDSFYFLFSLQKKPIANANNVSQCDTIETCLLHLLLYRVMCSVSVKSDASVYIISLYTSTVYIHQGCSFVCLFFYLFFVLKKLSHPAVVAFTANLNDRTLRHSVANAIWRMHSITADSSVPENPTTSLSPLFRLEKSFL